MIAADNRLTRYKKNVINGLLATMLLASCTLWGCGQRGDATRVFVASSMTDFIEELIAIDGQNGSANATDVNIAGSGTLLLQINEGDRADVVILAGAEYMEELNRTGDFHPPTEFAMTNLSIVIAPDLRDKDLTVRDLWSGNFQGAMCVLSAPCGQLAGQYAASENLDMAGLSLEPNVRAVLAKIERGEVDFGFVYHTDLLSSTAGVAEVQGSGASKFSTSYSFAVANNLKHSPQARSLTNAMTGEVGQRILEELGFNQP